MNPDVKDIISGSTTLKPPTDAHHATFHPGKAKHKNVDNDIKAKTSNRMCENGYQLHMLQMLNMKPIDHNLTRHAKNRDFK